MKKSFYLPVIGFLAFSFHLSATNIRITDLTTELPVTSGGNLVVRCTLSWDNAWRDPAMNNHDAAWVFLKFKPNAPDMNSQHFLLRNEGHRVLQSLSNCPAPELEVSTDQVGLYVYLSKNYRGRVEWALELAFDPTPLGRMDAKDGVWSLHAIEMAVVPEGAFTLGDPDPAAQKAASFFRAGDAGGAAGLYTISDENQVIPVGDAPGSLNYRTSRAQYQGDRKGPVPAAFPKGAAAFYIMKYEITQGQYAAFLNALGKQASYFRANFSGKDYEKQRGSLYENQGQYLAKNPDRPLNFVSWDDGCAFADWAGLRPMTELEFEKACRGSATPIPHEFPWGTANKEQLARFVDLDDELKYRAGVDESQLNASNRAILGASACGAMDLAGSLWERVVSIGHPVGRAYRGTHGDGRISDYGYATNEDWPRGDDERGGGYGYRGGGYYEHGKPEGDFNPHSPIGWRNYAAWSGGPRSIAYGFRCVRSLSNPATGGTSSADAIIRKNIADFSANLVAGNYKAVVAAYTDDAKIFPPSRDIMAGSAVISSYWTPAGDAKSRTVYHKVTPSEITITGDTAYDWGYYEGATENEKGERSNWRGKYVIVWKEVSPGDWKIYLDCWNRISD